MKKQTINEDIVHDIVKKVLSEEVSKVNRNDYNKVQFKMDELENQLVETIKEMRKLQDSIPDGLKSLTNGRMNTIASNLTNSHGVLKQLKYKVKEHKKSSYQQQVDEKKNK